MIADVDEGGVAVAVDGIKVGVASASKVIATTVGIKSDGNGVGMVDDVELLHLQARTASMSTAINRLIQNY